VPGQNVFRLFLLSLVTLAMLPARQGLADPVEPMPAKLAHYEALLIEGGIFGAASTYNPFAAPTEPEGFETASGEFYDPDRWTAAIRTDLRDQFGGIRFGRNYRPTFALVECGDKKAIVRVNDVGPLAPGRVIDLSDRTMRYFDPGFQLGLLRNAVVTPLPGDDWVAGPLTDDAQIAASDPPTGKEIIAGFNAIGRLQASPWAVSDVREPRQRVSDGRRLGKSIRDARE
jgi:rare lipoprotein A